MGRKVQDPVDRLVDGYNELTAQDRRAFWCAIRAVDKAKGLSTGPVAAEQPRKVGRPRKASENPASEIKGVS